MSMPVATGLPIGHQNHRPPPGFRRQDGYRLAGRRGLATAQPVDGGQAEHASPVARDLARIAGELGAQYQLPANGTDPHAVGGLQALEWKLIDRRRNLPRGLHGFESGHRAGPGRRGNPRHAGGTPVKARRHIDEDDERQRRGTRTLAAAGGECASERGRQQGRSDPPHCCRLFHHLDYRSGRAT
jgi:hypothetical protein